MLCPVLIQWLNYWASLTHMKAEWKLSAKTSKQKSPRMGALIMHRCTTNHSEMQWLKTTKNVISHCFCGFSYRHDSVECLWLKISHEFMLICQLEYLFYLKAQLWKRVLENNFPKPISMFTDKLQFFWIWHLQMTGSYLPSFCYLSNIKHFKQKPIVFSSQMWYLTIHSSIILFFWCKYSIHLPAHIQGKITTKIG